jgi:CRP-like cAMP-binding protein
MFPWAQLPAVRSAMPAAARPLRPEYARIRRGFASSAYFRALPAQSLDRLASAATLERFDRGGVVQGSGPVAGKFWLVLAGGMRVSWLTGQGLLVPVAMIGVGSFYSAGALVEGARYQTECTAERGTVAASIEAAALRVLEEADPAIRALVPKLILQRFQAVTALYADLVSAHLPQRLARRLMAQALATGDGEVGDLELRTSQADLALMLGASRSRVNADLRKLERDEILRLGYRRVFVRDFKRLCTAAGARVQAL